MPQVVGGTGNPQRLTRSQSRRVPKRVVLGTPAPVTRIETTDSLKHDPRNHDTDRPGILLNLGGPRNLRRPLRAPQHLPCRGLVQIPKLSELRPHRASLASFPNRSLKLLLRHPRITVSYNRDIPVTGNMRRRIDRLRTVKRANHMVTRDQPEILIIRPDPSLHIPPQLITMPIIIAPRNQHRDRLLTKLRVQRQGIAVHLPPQHVLTMIGRRDTRLILIPAAKLRVNHIHERVLSQPRPVSPARKTFVEPAPLTPRVV